MMDACEMVEEGGRGGMMRRRELIASQAQLVQAH